MLHAVLWTARARQTTISKISTGFALSLVRNTGGRYTAVAAPTAFDQALRQLAADMAAHHDRVSKRYRLLYEPPDERGARVSVDVLRPGLEVQLYGDRRIDP